MRYFLGPIVELQVVEGQRVQEIPVEDTVRMFVRSAAGVMGTIDLSWSLNKELPYYSASTAPPARCTSAGRNRSYRRAGDADWTVFGKGTTRCKRSAASWTTSRGRSADGTVAHHRCKMRSPRSK